MSLPNPVLTLSEEKISASGKKYPLSITLYSTPPEHIFRTLAKL